MDFRILAAAAALAFAPLAADAQTRPIVVGQGFLTDSLDPAQGVAGWALQSHGVAETLFTVDRQGRIVPNLAEAVRRDGESFVIRLKPDLKFADGSLLDATALKASLDRATKENPRARAQIGTPTLDVLDAREVRLRPERPVAAIESVLAEYPLAIHKFDGTNAAMTGPFRAVEFKRGESLRLEPNPFYREAGARPNVTIRRIGDAQTLALGLESGEVDIAFNLAPETLPRLKRRPELAIKSTPVAYQYMMLLNTQRAPFDDTRVRRAVDLAIDRSTLIAAANGGETATGMFPRVFPFASEAPRKHDPREAERLLDEAGWKAGANGQRMKDGRILEFTLTTYPQRPDLVTIAPVIRASLERVGFRVRIETTEAISPQLQAKRFDGALWAMHAAPGGDGAFVFEQYLRSTAATNFMSFADAQVDAGLDRLREIDAAPARATALKGIEQLVFAQAPIVYLMTPVWHVGLSKRAASYVPYPSDYYVLRADLRASP
jgi:peptide/nickel transport system substrate-binding protein